MSTENSFELPFESFDLSLIGLSASEIGSPKFIDAVSAFFAKQFEKFGGRARVMVNDTRRTISVSWTKDRNWKSPKDVVLSLLNGGKMLEAIPLIWTLIQERPDDTDNYFNLGVSYSELGDYPKAIDVLQELLRRDSKHAHGWTALGVAQIRMGKLAFGEEALRKALTLEPNDPWALRNLGACLMKQERFGEAVELLEEAIVHSPNDVQAIVGLAQALEHADRIEDADEYYERAIGLGGPQSLVDLAKERRTALAHQTMRSRGGSVRPDVVMYLSGALDRFKSMSTKDIQNLGFEIAILGQSGLDINDPSQKYSLKSLPGKFSGLHLCAIMYAAFKQFAPHEDVGIDFSNEYETATSLQ